MDKKGACLVDGWLQRGSGREIEINQNFDFQSVGNFWPGVWGSEDQPQLVG